MIVDGMCRRRSGTLRKLTRLMKKSSTVRSVELCSLASVRCGDRPERRRGVWLTSSRSKSTSCVIVLARGARLRAAGTISLKRRRSRRVCRPWRRGPAGHSGGLNSSARGCRENGTKVDCFRCATILTKIKLFRCTTMLRCGMGIDRQIRRDLNREYRCAGSSRFALLM